MLVKKSIAKAKGLVSRVFKRLFVLFGKLPRKKNVIIFESFHGKQFSCNPRAIYEYLLENHPEFDMYWSINKSERKKFEHENIQILTRFTFKWVYYMATAKYWVINARLPLWMRKPENTVYIQTWHGTPLKKLGIDIADVKMPGTTTEKYRINFTRESGNWDYLIAPNKYSADIFTRAFGFKGKMLLSGYPRNDALYNKDHAEFTHDFKEKNGLPKNKKIILYAPTWRDDEYIEVGKYKFSLKLDLEEMRKKLGNDYILLLRMHYLVADKLDIENFKGFAYNFSDYDDIRDLYIASDLLITDYSSVFFDYANLNRPVIFYVYDIDKYRDQLRGFYFDLELSAPGPLVKTTSTLIEAIKNTDHDQNKKINHAFYDKYCDWEDGNAAKRVVDEVFLNSSPSGRE